MFDRFSLILTFMTLSIQSITTFLDYIGEIKKRHHPLYFSGFKVVYSTTFQVSRATIDLTSDAMTDASSDGESYEGLSPVRRVHKLLHTSSKLKPRRKKKMPPELRVIPATQVTKLV